MFENPYPKKLENTKTRREKDRNQTYNVNQSKCKKCIICEKNDHVPTITRKGNLIVSYFACDKFAKMSPKERFVKLKEKKLVLSMFDTWFESKTRGELF